MITVKNLERHGPSIYFTEGYKEVSKVTGVDPRFKVVMLIEKAKEEVGIPDNPKDGITMEQFNKFCQFIYKIILGEMKE